MNLPPAPDLPTLTARAREIQSHFDAVNTARGRTPWTSADLIQGFAVDVGDLTKLVMAANGRRDVANLESKLAHELADCLWSILVLADHHHVDVTAAFIQTMNDLETKLHGELTALATS